MKRKSMKVGDYEVCELAVREMLPVMRLMSEDAENGQLHLLGAAVKVNGIAIGYDAVEELGMSDYMKLVNAVTKLNGLDEVGND